MFEAVQCFQSGSAPKLSASKQHYEVVEGEVHYVDPISRVPDSSISYGYTTAFTYFHCRELGKLAWKDVGGGLVESWFGIGELVWRPLEEWGYEGNVNPGVDMSKHTLNS